MPYTRAWDPANMLLGSRDADEIDDAVRDFANDLDERFTDILVDPDADPWQLKTRGATTVLHWSAASIIPGAGSNLAFSNEMLGVTGVSDGFYAFVPIVLPVGSTLTSVVVRVKRTIAGATCNIMVTKVDTSDTGVTLAGPTTPAVNAAAQDVDMGTLNEVLGLGERFVVRISLAADGVTAATIGLYSVTYTADIVWGS